MKKIGLLYIGTLKNSKLEFYFERLFEISRGSEVLGNSAPVDSSQK